MTVSGVNSVVPGRETGTAVKTEELGQDDFLNLLIAQLQAQDPLNPLESAEFTAQLAQFNSLEKLMEVNTRLGELKAAQLFSANAQFVDYIGKTVKASGNTVSLAEGESPVLSFDLASPAKSVAVTIIDAAGARVRTLAPEETGAGERSVEWNGKDDKGRRVPDGTYRFEVAAVDERGGAVEAAPFMLNRITGVTFQDDAAVLLARNQTIPLARVIRVSESENR